MNEQLQSLLIVSAVCQWALMIFACYSQNVFSHLGEKLTNKVIEIDNRVKIFSSPYVIKEKVDGIEREIGFQKHEEMIAYIMLQITEKTNCEDGKN